MIDKPFVGCECEFNDYGECMYEDLDKISYGKGSYKYLPKNIKNYANNYELLFDKISLSYVDAILLIKGYPEEDPEEDKEARENYSDAGYKQYLDHKKQNEPLSFENVCRLFQRINILEIEKDDDFNLFTIYEALS